MTIQVGRQRESLKTGFTVRECVGVGVNTFYKPVFNIIRSFSRTNLITN